MSICAIPVGRLPDPTSTERNCARCGIPLKKYRRSTKHPMCRDCYDVEHYPTTKKRIRDADARAAKRERAAA